MLCAETQSQTSDNSVHGAERYAMAIVESAALVPAVSKVPPVLSSSEEGKELNGIIFESFSHTGTILKGLNELRLKGVLVDVTLQADGKKFRVSFQFMRCQFNLACKTLIILFTFVFLLFPSLVISAVSFC